MNTSTKKSPCAIVMTHLRKIGCADFHQDRIFVRFSPRMVEAESPRQNGHVHFSLDEKQAGKWCRVDYSLLLDDDGNGQQLSCQSPAGVVHKAGEHRLGIEGEWSEEVCTGYDLTFLSWFALHGTQIHIMPSGLSVWTHDGSQCPFDITSEVVYRLAWTGHIDRIFPQHSAKLDYVWEIKK